MNDLQHLINRYMRGQLSQEEEARFKERCQEEVEYAKEARFHMLLWAQLRELEKEKLTKQTLSGLATLRKRKRRWWRWLSITGGLIIAILIYLFFFGRSEEMPYENNFYEFCDLAAGEGDNLREQSRQAFKEGVALFNKSDNTAAAKKIEEARAKCKSLQKDFTCCDCEPLYLLSRIAIRQGKWEEATEKIDSLWALRGSDKVKDYDEACSTAIAEIPKLRERVKKR